MCHFERYKIDYSTTLLKNRNSAYTFYRKLHLTVEKITHFLKK